MSKTLHAPLGKKLHISYFSYGTERWVATASQSTSNILRSTGFGGLASIPGGLLINLTRDYAFTGVGPLEATYSIGPRLQLGLSWYRIPEQAVGGTSSRRENVSGTSIGLLVDFVLLPVNPLLDRRWEIAAGLGLSSNHMIVEGGLFTTQLSWEFRKIALGGHVKGSIDYFVTRQMSMQFKLERNLISKINVPEQNLASYYMVEQHTLGLSGSNALLSLRLHL